MSEYFYHNINWNLKNRGEFAKPVFGPNKFQTMKAQKTRDLQKGKSFNYISDRFQNII